MKNLHANEVALTRSIVLTKAMMRAADRLGMSGKQLSDVIGLSAAQISRIKNGEAALSEASKPFELSALLVRVFRSLDAIVGGDESATKLWMTSQTHRRNKLTSPQTRTEQRQAHARTRSLMHARARAHVCRASCRPSPRSPHALTCLFNKATNTRLSRSSECQKPVLR